MAASKLRTVRVVEDGRWERAAERADREGTTVSAVLNAALLTYAPAPAPEPEQARSAA